MPGLAGRAREAEAEPLGNAVDARCLSTVLAQLRAIAGYPTAAVVRVPFNDPVLIKQFLDLGAQSLIVPMVNTPAQARDAAAAVHYPPRGIRGVGSALITASTP